MAGSSWLVSERAAVMAPRSAALAVALLSAFALPCASCVQSRVLGTGRGPLAVGVEVFDPAGRRERDQRVSFEDPPSAQADRAEFGPRETIQPLSALPLLGAPREAAARGGQDQKPAPAGPGEQGKNSGDEASADAAPQGEQESPFARFGSNIIVNKDGKITKWYYVPQRTALILQAMLKPPTAGPSKAGTNAPGAYHHVAADPKSTPKGLLQRLLEGHEITLEVIGNWDQARTFDQAVKTFSTPLRQLVAGDTNDLLLVTADPDGLEKFEQTLNLFYAQVPQIEIEVVVYEFSIGDTLDIGVSQLGTDPTIKTKKDSFVQSILSRFPNAAVASGTVDASEGLLSLGGIHDNIELAAVIELLQSQTKADIVSHPKIAVRNSGIAQIDTTSKVPYPKATIKGNNVETSIDFKDVGVTLRIRPVIQGTETIELNIFAQVSAVTGFADTDPVDTPIVSTRSALTSVFVPNGQSVVIGGLIQTTEFENESKIPVLGDIPLLGYLFRSTFTQRTKSELLFTITAHILQGLRPSERGPEVVPLSGG